MATKYLAELLDGTRIEYRDLKVGDIFRPYRILTGTYHSIEDNSINPNCYGKVEEAPQPSGMRGRGYEVQVIFGTFTEIQAVA